MTQGQSENVNPLSRQNHIIGCAMELRRDSHQVCVGLPVLLFVMGLGTLAHAADDIVVRVGSKAFTESVILGEILTKLAESTGTQVIHRQELGGTEILWQALLAGEVDAYPEYTGTIIEQILDGADLSSFEELEQALAEYEIRISRPLGFNNTYALGVPRGHAEEMGLESISDLARYADLTFGFSFEFLERHDGWPGLKSAYNLPHTAVRGMDHALAYEAIKTGAIDVMDLYSTDAEITAYDLLTLRDERNYFPKYEAVILSRADLNPRAPEVVKEFSRLAAKIDDTTMTDLNSRAKIDGIPEDQVAVEFLNRTFNLGLKQAAARRFNRFLINTREHVLLVGISLAAAIVIAIPLGVLAHRFAGFEGPIMGIVGVIQTMPSLALLVFMIPLFGLGALPAIVALFLYSLLPIVRNTLTGLQQIPPSLRESAQVLGLTGKQRLWLIELPMASPSILAGIKTAAVINVGTATLGALINAGGYGQPIITGLRLGSTSLLLQGAIPAAVLALLVQWGFGQVERFVVPAGLRSAAKSAC